MTEQQIQEKLAGMKKTRKTLGKVTLCVSILAIILLVAYNFIGVVFCKTEFAQVICNVHFEQGYSFPGWQVVFWGMGNQYIMGGQLFDPNPLAIAAMIGTILVLIVCTALKKGKNKAKAIREFISAACLCFSALVLGFFIAPVSLMTATDNLSQFRSNVLNVPGTIYNTTAAAIIVGVVLILFAAVKVYNALFLLKQKKFAAQYAPKNTKGDK